MVSFSIEVALTPEVIDAVGPARSQATREYILKYRRREVYNNTQEKHNGINNMQNNYFLDITLQEQLETLERLGLPAPVIESPGAKQHGSALLGSTNKNVWQLAWRNLERLGLPAPVDLKTAKALGLDVPLLQRHSAGLGGRLLLNARRFSLGFGRGIVWR